MPADVDTDTKTEDFYTKLLNTIDADEHERAIAMVMEIQDRQEQLGVLANLARDLARDLNRAHALGRDRALALDLARDLARDLNRARARALARDLGRGLARDLDLARARLRVIIAVSDKLGKC